MKKTGILLFASLLLLTGCAAKEQKTAAPAPSAAYQQIDQETARQILAQEGSSVLVDVRRLDEYESGHIPGAICIPNESIGGEKPVELPNPNQVLLLYCRSGNRSKQAAEKLAGLGYIKVYEFGGINDWTGEVVQGQTLTVTLESNPTTGFRWQVEQDGECFDVREYYVSEPQTQPLAGAGGWQTFLLTPKQSGAVELRFTYTRPWENSDVEPQFRCELEISEALAVTVTDNGASEAAQSGYTPVIRIY